MGATMTRLLLAAVLASVALAGCADDSKVGSGVDLSFEEQVNQNRLGQTTTTTGVVAEDAAPGEQLAVGQRTTTTPPPTTAPPTTEAPAPPTLEVGIYGDEAGTQFHPSVAKVYVGSFVKWTNLDSRGRSVVADAGEFESPELAPGESFTYTATKTGAFNYHDGSRPYAVGRLEVIEQ